MKTDELNADNSTRMYLDKINMLLDTPCTSHQELAIVKWGKNGTVKTEG